MHTTSQEEMKSLADLPKFHDASDRCQLCGARVDLRKSLIIVKDRVMGCGACDWGAARVGNA